MTDKELLELAAKAAGLEIGKWVGETSVIYSHNGYGAWTWNPLADDGDALRLADACNLSISRRKGAVFVVGDDYHCAMEDYGADRLAATRRAIVRAAAEVGKQMEGASNE